MLLPKTFSLTVTLLSLTILQGCSVFQQQDYSDKKNQLIESVAWQQANQGEQITYITDLLHDEQLSQYIEESLRANAELQQSFIALKIVQQQYILLNGERLPSAALDLTTTKLQNSAQTYNGGFDISWSLDIWGKLADQSKAGLEAIYEEQALNQKVKDTLVAEVMQSWIELTHLNNQMEIGAKRIQILKQNEQLIYQRYRAGLGTLEDLVTSKTSTASAKATQVARAEQLAQQQRIMNVLLGRTSSSHAIQFNQDYPQVITPVASLPAQTLARRPDLQAAWHAIQAAQYDAKVAYKNLLPSVNLGASFSGTGSSPTEALIENPVWSLLGQLTAPLFQGGALKANAKIADLTQAQTYQVYRQTLLTAVQEVENAIGQEKSITSQIVYVKQALDNSYLNLSQYQEKYKNGLVTMLDLLNIQEQAFDLELQMDELLYQQISNRITLGLALGLGVAPND